MLPYFQITHFGPIKIWGLFVGLGILVSLLIAYRLRRDERLWDLAFWSILFALLGGRLFGIFEDLSYYLAHPLEILKVWQGGMAISGGIIGGIIAGIIYLHRHHLGIWEYANLAAFVFPLGEAIGRIGCFLLFDHPGTATNFFLGQEYVDGVVRHNHGLYLMLNGLILFLVFLILRSFKFQHFAALFLLEYGLLRFFLDFLRIADQQFLSLAIAQYFVIIFIFFGIGLFFLKVDRKR